MAADDSMLDSQSITAQLESVSNAPQWLLGFSGGLDSTVLLHLLCTWRKANASAPPLSAVHINHGLQDSADSWQDHCAELCQQWTVPFTSVALQGDTIASGEAGARSARYGVFRQHLIEGGVLFLAHHQDDQVETFFLRLMRGAGVTGLAGIPRTRPLADGAILRPLLSYSRKQLEGYGEKHALPYIDDPSNTDTQYDRNFLRQKVLPLLASRWPAYRDAVGRAMMHQASAIAVLEEAVGLPKTLVSATGDLGVSQSDLLECSLELASIRLRTWLQLQQCALPDTASLHEFLRQLREAEAEAKPTLKTQNYTLKRYRDAIYRVNEHLAPVPAVPMVLVPGQVLAITDVGEVSLQKSESGEGFEWDGRGELSIAWRLGGERCQPRGRGGSSSLKKVMQELGIPPWWRDRIPLLYCNDSLLALGDLLVCEPQKRADSGARQRGDLQRWRLVWTRETMNDGYI